MSGLATARRGTRRNPAALLLALLGAAVAGPHARATLAPERVLVLYNARDTADEDGDGVPDSRQVA